MASNSKSIELRSSNNYLYYLNASFTENSTDIGTNKSSVTCTATLTSTNARWSSSYNSTLEIYWHDNKENYDRFVASINLKDIATGGSASASGTIDVEHNSNGKISGYAYAKFTKGGTSAWCPNSGGVTTDWTELTTIPRQANLNTAPDFNDEQNPTITYTNSAGNSATSLDACISIDGYRDDISYRAVNKTGSSYTFNLTEAERNVLRNACTTAKSRTVIFYLRTVIGGNTYYSTITKTMSIVNANPTFSNSQLSYTDTNATVTAITQDASKIVRNQSTLQVTFTGATAKKGASITNYQMKFNGATDTGNAPFTKNYGIVNLSENQKVQVIVTDSRGNQTTIEKTITILDWVNPTAVIILGRRNNYEDQTNIKVQASCSSVNSKNSIQSIKYRYKKTTDATYGADVTINNNTQYTFSISKDYAWDVQVVITDKFGTTTYNLVVAKGKPIFFIDITKLAVGVNCFPTNNNSFALNGQDVLEYDVIDTW